MAQYFTSEFISFTAAGLRVATFTEIRSALIQKYQDIYGSDIDLSTGSADGVFVDELALLINNICQTCLVAYSNLDINFASGKYLDALCALSNVFRKQPTRSSVSINILNVSNSTITMDNPIFLDQANVEWEYQGTITLDPSDSMEIIVVCKELGEITAPTGWITKTIDVNGIVVTQSNAAYIGQSLESDADLRARRAQSSGANGTTTIESLIGSLLQLSGIRDVKVFNNNSDATVQIAGDNTYVPAHQIYVCVQKMPNVIIEDSTIGEIIHQKITPGVLTTETTSGSGTNKSYQYIDNVYGRQVLESTEDIYWKEAAGIHPNITIEVGNLFHFNQLTCYAIANNVINYINALPLGTTVYTKQVRIENVIENSDPLYRGSQTFKITSISIPSSVNPWAYYDYHNISAIATHEDGDPDKPVISYTITLS